VARAGPPPTNRSARHWPRRRNR
jgi:ParB/RepB/Spo0J family partition protein